MAIHEPALGTQSHSQFVRAIYLASGDDQSGMIAILVLV